MYCKLTAFVSYAVKICTHAFDCSKYEMSRRFSCQPRGLACSPAHKGLQTADEDREKSLF